MGSVITPPPKTSPQYWAEEVAAAEKNMEKFWKRADVVVKRYLDERDAMMSGMKWFNIFYANVGIMESAIYADLPQPVVTRRFLDYKDDVARVGALILERCIKQDYDDPLDNTDATFKHCVQDRLVSGLAQAWLRLETLTEDVELSPVPIAGVDPYGPPMEMTVEVPQPPMPQAQPPQPGQPPAEPSPPQTYKKIVQQKVCVDYVYWKDFLFSSCRVWEERRWVARKVYMTRDELVKRFGSKGNAAPLNFSNNGRSGEDQTPKDNLLRKACVYEIWDRTDRKVYWYIKGYGHLLDIKDDFLNLEGFEPCPRPLLANISTSSTVPRPDYYMLQDQYQELDDVNNRISRLVKSCKVVGVYDKAQPAVARMLQEGTDNMLIPTDNWAMFAEKQGMKGSIDWLPLEQIINALRELNAAREVIKGQIYELSGIADIVRGASKASETLGAQKLKAQFASVRIKKLQDEVARFAGDVLRIKGEIMVKHFDPDILIQKSNINQTDDKELVPQALELLQSDDGFEWRIEVLPDSIAQADYAVEKQDRIEFLNAFSGFVNSAGQSMAALPGSEPLFIGLLKWAISAFQGVKDIEGMLDKTLDTLSKQPDTPKPDPEAEKAKAELALKERESQAKMQLQQQKAQQDAAAAQQQMAFDQQRQQMEMAAEQARINNERMMMQMQLQFTTQMNELKIMLAETLGRIKLEVTREQGEASVEAKKATAAVSNNRTND